MTGRTPATMRHRVLAVVIDSALAAAVIVTASGVVLALWAFTAGGVPVWWLLPVLGAVGVAALLVQSALQGGRGSVGMRVAGVRLAHAADDADLGFGRALGRNLIWALTGSILVGVFSPLFDPTRWRRGWHDLASGALVIDVAPAPSAQSDGSRGSVAAAAVGAAVVATSVAPPAPVPSREPVPSRLPAPAPAAAVLAAPGPVGGAAPVGVAAAPAGPAWAPASVPAHRRIPRTLPVDVISTVPGVPHRDGRPAAAERVDPPVIAVLCWDDGTRHTVYEPSLFGRGPGVQPGRRSTAVRDETLSLSKTHFEIGADAEGTWVVDRHSLNGVVIVRGGQPQRLVPGRRARVWSGDLLELGDRRLTVEIAR